MLGEVYEDGRLLLEHGNRNFDASLRDGTVQPLISDFVSRILGAGCPEVSPPRDAMAYMGSRNLVPRLSTSWKLRLHITIPMSGCQ